MSYFDQVELLPEDPIFSQLINFRADTRPQKVNLAIGAYKDENGKSYVLNCVRKAEQMLFDRMLDKDYLLMDGDHDFCHDVQKLLFDHNLQEHIAKRIFTVQTIGGSGALRLAAEFLNRHGYNKLYLPDPTWPNHTPIFTRANLVVESYVYFNPKTHDLDFGAMCESIHKLPSKSVILLHACCQNPVGIDLSEEQWRTLSALIKKQGLLPFFDFAYQGFATGVKEDAFPIKLFAEDGHEMLIASSFSKNFGLYGERIGALTAVTHSPEAARKVGSQFKQLVRSNYSSPPLTGARIIHAILSHPELSLEWEQELISMRDRIDEMRELLCNTLENSGKIDVSFLRKQRGMFAYGALNASQTERLKQEFAIYMPPSGRISVPGLTHGNLRYVAESIITVL